MPTNGEWWDVLSGHGCLEPRTKTVERNILTAEEAKKRAEQYSRDESTAYLMRFVDMTG